MFYVKINNDYLQLGYPYAKVKISLFILFHQIRKKKKINYTCKNIWVANIKIIIIILHTYLDVIILNLCTK